MASDKPSDAPSTHRFEPLTRLATGGMAEIWLAREIGAAGFERVVVIKRLLPHLAHERHIVEMFASEARFVARLVHPNVVQIHELGQDEDGYFLVMEYVAGCSVRELMGAAREAKQRLPPEIGVCIVEQACRGLHAAHELVDSTGRPLGLVHRDVTPHNLMVGPDGDVKLLDFGIAKATEAADSTHTGSLKGKYGYMSPEQCRAQPLDRRSDLFAMGIVTWELLVGERLFDRGNEYDSLQAIVEGDVKPPSEACPDVPHAFDAVVMKALAVRPEKRWSTADELRRALVAAAEEANVRPSRDALAAKLSELVGELVEERVRSLQSFANAPSTSGRRAREATDSGEPPTLVDVRGGSASRSDEAPTVVQRRLPSHPPEALATPSSPPPAPGEATALETTRTIDRAGPRSQPARSRPWALLAAGGVAVLAAALVVAKLVGAGGADGDAAPAASSAALSGPPMRFVIAPTVDRATMIAELEPFRRWLERTTSRPVELVIARSYHESGELVASGRAEIGLLPPLLFVQTVARHPRLRPLALRLFEGSRGSDAYLLVRDDTGIGGAKDLRGRTVCFVDQESTTGYLLPRIWLREAGVDPDADLRALLSGDHMAALRDLAARRCDAAAVYSGAYLSARQEGIEVGPTRVLAITGRVPQDVMAAAPDLPAAEATRIQRALLAFDAKRDTDAGFAGGVLGITGFAPFEAAEFDRIREAAAREGLLEASDDGTRPATDP